MQYQQRIKELRIDADEKQDTIAAALDITKQQYSLYETGKRELPLKHLKTLCILYGVSADYILGLPKGLNWPR